MNTMFAGVLGGWEMVLILAVILVLFGAKKLPELAKGLGQGIKEFKKATNEVQNEIHQALEEPPPPSTPRRIESSSQPAPATPVTTEPEHRA